MKHQADIKSANINTTPTTNIANHNNINSNNNGSCSSSPSSSSSSSSSPGSLSISSNNSAGSTTSGASSSTGRDGSGESGHLGSGGRGSGASSCSASSNSSSSSTTSTSHSSSSSSSSSSTTGSNSSSSSNVTAFLSKLWRLVNDHNSNDLICWSPNGCFFVIQNQIQFAKDLLPLYFKHSNMASFIRQLNMYGFRKIPFMNGNAAVNGDQRTDIAQFYHNNFERGQEYKLTGIKRKNNSSKTHNLMVNGAFCEQVRLLLREVHALRDGQNSSESILGTLQTDNKSLWRDVALLRSQHHKQRRVIERIIQFLSSLVQNKNSMMSKKHKIRLMINASECASGSARTNSAGEQEDQQGPAQQKQQQQVVANGTNGNGTTRASTLSSRDAAHFVQTLCIQSGGLDERMSSANRYENQFGGGGPTESSLTGAGGVQSIDLDSSGIFSSNGVNDHHAYLSVSSGFAQQQQQQQHQVAVNGGSSGGNGTTRASNMGSRDAAHFMQTLCNQSGGLDGRMSTGRYENQFAGGGQTESSLNNGAGGPTLDLNGSRIFSSNGASDQHAYLNVSSGFAQHQQPQQQQQQLQHQQQHSNGVPNYTSQLYL